MTYHVLGEMTTYTGSRTSIESAVEMRRYAMSRGLLEPINPEEERRLIRRAKAGDSDSRERVCVKYISLACKLANRFRRTIRPCHGYSVEDLFQVAMLGINRAIDFYDPDQGTSFLTYAFLLAQRDLSTIWKQRKMNDHLSDEESSMLAAYEHHDYEDEEQIKLELRSLIDQLKPKHRDLLRRNYGIDTERMTQREIAAQRGVTHQAISQQVERAEQHLRQLIEDKGFDPDFESRMPYRGWVRPSGSDVFIVGVY